MPLLRNRNPKYRKHRPSGQAMVTISGRDFYLGPWQSAASKIEYDRLVGEWLTARRQPPGSRLPDLRVAELIERFRAHAEKYYRRPDRTPSGEADAFKPALAIVNGLYGATAAANFGPLALENCRRAMIEKGWCRTHINAQVSRVKLVFSWGVSQELLPPSVHHALSTIKGLRMGKTEARESEPVRPVPDCVVDETIRHLSSVVGAMVQIQRLSGARPGEICGMKIGEIDRSSPVWIFRPAAHKTQHYGHDRVIFIGPKAQKILQSFMLKLDPAAHVFSPADAVAELRQRRSEDRKTPLSCGNTIGSNRKRKPNRMPGKFYEVAAYRRAISRACKLAFPPSPEIASDRKMLKEWRRDRCWHPHQLRHSAATDIRRQFGLEAAQQILGHSTLSATRIYAERSSEAARQIAAKIG
jgi:integrase